VLSARNGRSTYALALLTNALPRGGSRWLTYGLKAVVFLGIVSDLRSIYELEVGPPEVGSRLSARDRIYPVSKRL
jgi:hypothetical protein